MRAIILAAGRGSRMGINTKNKPKCLNKIKGQTLLEWQLKSLQNQRIHEVIVVTGYKSELLKGPFTTVDNPRWFETNMVSSLFCVEESDVDSIISYSDITFKSEYVDYLIQSEGDIVIIADKKWEDLWRLRFENPLEDAETFKTNESNELIEIGLKTRNIEEIEAQYTGLLKITRNGWSDMKKLFHSFSQEKRDKMDMTSMINEMINIGFPIRIKYIEGGWCEADTAEDIIKYEEKLNSKNCWLHDWR